MMQVLPSAIRLSAYQKRAQELEIYSKHVGGSAVHHAVGRWHHMWGAGIYGIWNILTEVGPLDPEPVLTIYRDIEKYLTGDYEVWASVDRERLFEVRIRFEGIEYSFDSLYEWKSSSRYLPNFRGRPNIRDMQLSHVRGEFLRDGLREDFDRLLAAWDLGVDNLHFEEFREALPAFLMKMLREAARMHPEVRTRDDIVAAASMEKLLNLALRGLMSDNEAAAAGLLPAEAFDYVNDDLQKICEFQDINNLVRYVRTDDLPPDADEIAFVVSRNHFIEALHEFLINLGEARLPIADGG